MKLSLKTLSHSPMYAAAVLALGLGGCAAALPVTADVAGAAIEKGPEAVKAGKIQTHQPLSMEEMSAITRQAAGELELKLTGQKAAADKTTLHYQDERHQDIAVTLIKRTPRVTQVLVDVGWFGDGGMAQLMLRQIMHDMPADAVRTHTETATRGE